MEMTLCVNATLDRMYLMKHLAEISQLYAEVEGGISVERLEN